MTKIDHKILRANPEDEDFRGKYETGKIGSKLVDNYFSSVKNHILKIPKSSKKMIAIELGCGEGLSTNRLKDMMPDNFALEASEYVKEQIPDAKKNNPGMKITQESIYELKHKDNTFDVFLLEVMEHLDYPEEGLKEIKRILKPNQYLILGVPREPIWRTLNFARGKYVKEFGNTPGHLNHWSSIALIKFINKNFGRVIATEKPIPWTIVLAKNEKS